MIFLTVGVLLALMIAICSYRVIVGPGIFNRIAAASAIGTKAMILLVIIGFVIERPHFVDIALMYGVLNFVGVIIMAKYLLKGELCSPSV